MKMEKSFDFQTYKWILNTMLWILEKFKELQLLLLLCSWFDFNLQEIQFVILNMHFCRKRMTAASENNHLSCTQF